MSFNTQVASAPAVPATNVFSLPCQPPVLEPGRPYVYVLPRKDRTSSKIGRSFDPFGRIAGLQYVNPEIDLARSVIIGVDSPRIEPILHAIFSARRQKRVPRCDGYTEWFEGDIAEEVVELCRCIAYYRRCDYPVFRNLEAMMAAYREANPCAGLRLPRETKAERDASRLITDQHLNKLAIEHAKKFIEILSERVFDGVIRQGDQYSIVRTINRKTEPECWKENSGPCGSDWSHRLLQAAQVTLRDRDSFCCFRLVKSPTVELLSDQQGREIYRVCEGPAVAIRPVDAPLLPDQRASRFLWKALKHLGVKDVTKTTIGL